jgi:ATP-dependent helicase HrpA
MALAAACRWGSPHPSPRGEEQDRRATPSPGRGRRTHKISNRQYEQLLRQNFISVRRVREWRDIHTQLLTVVAEHQWLENTSRPATRPAQGAADRPAGQRRLQDRGRGQGGAAAGEYLGARGIKFIATRARTCQAAGPLDGGAELVETTRLYGRGMAPSSRSGWRRWRAIC